MTSIAQSLIEEGMEKGLKVSLKGLKVLLKLKFGNKGIELMNIIEKIDDLDKINTIFDKIESTQNLKELENFIKNLLKNK